MAVEGYAHNQLLGGVAIDIVVHRVERLAVPAGVDGILGLRKVGQTLLIEPCIPQDWAE